MSSASVDLTISLRSVLSAVVGVAPEEVTPSASLASDFDLDRFDALELLDVLEEAFSVSIPDEAVSEFVTVGDVERFLRAARVGVAA